MKILMQFLIPNKKKERTKDDKGSKVFFSPRLGFSAWSSSMYFQVAPIFGYKFTSRFWLGAGPEYIYLKEESLQAHIYGGTSFAYLTILDNIDEVIPLGIGSLFLYLENEVLSIKPISGERKWHDLLLGGVGIRMPLRNRMGFSLIVVWGLNNASNMLYNSPEVRFMYDL
jgi:hypothetical protein